MPSTGTRHVQLITQDLTIARGGRTVIADLSLAAEAGETLVLTGPNGVGKSTLIRTLAGLLQPSSGTIRLDGGDPESGIGEQCHLVGHLNAVKPSLTVGENAQFWLEYLSDGAAILPFPLKKGERDKAIDTVAAALDHFTLLALRDIPARYLSAGQTRRLGLVRLLVAKRPVWLLDEPTVSLDAASTALLAAAIAAHTATGGIAVAATHIPLGLERTRTLALAPADNTAAA